MPYKREGKVIYHLKGGKWTIKQKCGSEEDAKAALRLLEGVEHSGFKPTGKKRKSWLGSKAR